MCVKNVVYQSVLQRKKTFWNKAFLGQISLRNSTFHLPFVSTIMHFSTLKALRSPTANETLFKCIYSKISQAFFSTNIFFQEPFRTNVSNCGTNIKDDFYLCFCIFSKMFCNKYVLLYHLKIELFKIILGGSQVAQSVK